MEWPHWLRHDWGKWSPLKVAAPFYSLTDIRECRTCGKRQTRYP